MDIKCFGFYFIVSIIFTPLFYITPDSEKNYIEAVYKKWKKNPIYKISTDETSGYEPYEFFNQEEIEKTFCDCTFIPSYKKPSSGKCSDIQKEYGCIEYVKKKTYLFKNTKLYVKFYDADYLTLFERIHKEKKHFGKCKTGYKILES